MAEVEVHHGSYTSIQPTASPGLVFLSRFLPVLDSLETNSVPSVSDFLSEDAKFIFNGAAPVTASQVIAMLASRPDRLFKFGHNISKAWDITKEDGTRTVMYEATSVTVFKADPDLLEVTVGEFNIIELIPVPEEQGGVGGFIATELRTYMDSSPVQKRWKLVHGATDVA